MFGGRLGDLIGRKITFLAGALGFAAASAVGGAATSFGMLVAARATQGAFGALLAPAALSILSTTFSDPKDRGKAFGVYGAIVGAGAVICGTLFRSGPLRDSGSAASAQAGVAARQAVTTQAA
jgi:MFS family permease